MKLSLIVPVLNEEEAIPLFYKAVREFEPFQKYDIELVFVNDGSTDKTEAVLTEIETDDSLVKHISFTRNFGKQQLAMLLSLLMSIYKILLMSFL